MYCTTFLYVRQPVDEWWYSIVTKSTTLWTGINLQSPFVIVCASTFFIILKFSFSNSFVIEFVLISNSSMRSSLQTDDYATFCAINIDVRLFSLVLEKFFFFLLIRSRSFFGQPGLFLDFWLFWGWNDLNLFLFLFWSTAIKKNNKYTTIKVF